MAAIVHEVTMIRVSVDVPYRSRFPLDDKRRRLIEEKLQAYADGTLANLLQQLRYADDEEVE